MYIVQGVTLASHFVDQLEHIIPLWEGVGVRGGGTFADTEPLPNLSNLSSRGLQGIDVICSFIKKETKIRGNLGTWPRRLT
jgi:hypothetical protein